MLDRLLESLFESASLGVIGLGMFGGLLVFGLVGYALRRVRDRKRPAVEEADSGQEGYLVSAVLGLFALLLGFTFALAVDRYDARRLLVRDEATAIGAAYLRAQLMEPEHRERISRLLVEYTDNRITLANTRPPAPVAMLAANDELLTRLWQATVAAFPTIRDFDFSSSFLDSMNAVIELDEARKAARLAHVPSAVFVVLAIYAASVATVLGFVLTAIRGRIAGIILLGLFTLSVLLIIDIDRPATGGIRESQAPMERLRQSMTVRTPEVLQRLPD
jgi:hypothetical protein